MRIVNMHEAKTQLSRLVEQVLKGEEFIIARAGKPVARLVPYRPQLEERRLGAYKNEIEIPDDFDETDEEIVRLFEGKN